MCILLDISGIAGLKFSTYKLHKRANGSAGQKWFRLQSLKDWCVYYRVCTVSGLCNSAKIDQMLGEMKEKKVYFLYFF